MISTNHARAAAGLEPAPALYLFTGDTHVRTARRDRYGSRGTTNYQSPAVTVTILAPDQPAAERIAGAMLSTPEDTTDEYSSYESTHARAFVWDRVEPAPADTADAEALRQELSRTIAQLDEAQSAGRIALQQAQAERDRGDEYMRAIDRAVALTFASDDGTEYEHTGHGPAEGEPECPACWAQSIRRALEGAE